MVMDWQIWLRPWIFRWTLDESGLWLASGSAASIASEVFNTIRKSDIDVQKEWFRDRRGGVLRDAWYRSQTFQS